MLANCRASMDPSELGDAPQRAARSIAEALVHDVDEGLPRREAGEIVDEDLEAALLRSLRRGAVVGRDDRVRRGPEGAVLRKRLDRMGVEAGSRNPSFRECAEESVVVGD